jgi:hypothetical protein
MDSAGADPEIWENNPMNPKYHDELVPPHREPSWADFFQWFGEFYTMGEYGVIYADKRSPYRLIKVINCDITDGEGNEDQAEFFEINWKMDIEGLVKIHSFTRCQARSGIINPLLGKVATTNQDIVPVKKVLDLDFDDELAMWVMEKADYIGLTHPDLTQKEMLYRVANAAYNISTWTGEGMGDLKESNYGFRNDGSAFIFDFTLEARHKDYTITDYENYLSAIIGTDNPKV